MTDAKVILHLSERLVKAERDIEYQQEMTEYYRAEYNRTKEELDKLKQSLSLEEAEET